MSRSLVLTEYVVTDERVMIVKLGDGIVPAIYRGQEFNS